MKLSSRRPSSDTNHVIVQTGQDARGNVAVVVSDTGVGIEPDDLPYIFDPFFTTKDDASPGGLGLAAARAEIHSLGGEILVESLVGRGTRVRITLPAASALFELAHVPGPRVRGAEILLDRRSH